MNWGIAALVASHMMAIDVNIRPIVTSTYVQQNIGEFLILVSPVRAFELSVIPDHLGGVVHTHATGLRTWAERYCDRYPRPFLPVCG